MQAVKVITLHRPWPYAIVHLGMDIANRTWRYPIEDPYAPLAIHAGKKWDASAVAFIENLGMTVPPKDQHPTGIIAVCGVMRNVRNGETKSPWFVGPWGWELHEVHALEEPLAINGQQGLWDAPAEFYPLLLPHCPIPF